MRTITGVATAITAFVGRTPRGPTDTPSPVASFADFERLYGGLARDCPLGYAVRDFFDNGGRQAVIARIVHRDPTGTIDETAAINDADLADPSLEAAGRGLWLLDQADLVNILCIPPLAPGAEVGRASWDAAIGYATRRRAFVIVDPPAAWDTPAAAAAGVDQLVTRAANAALYFPRLSRSDPLAGNLLQTIAPCGAVAGVYARTDATRGVWKGPAGTEADLRGVSELATNLTDTQNQSLNSLAINALRSFPEQGHVVWGARTLAGTDGNTADWKYVPIRRLALYLEESIGRGTQWAVFEPNAEPLWAQLRASVGAFVQGLFRLGAFQGRTPTHAYFVKCDASTTTQDDIDQGVVNILVGFAPLKPAEFVVVRIQQRAGQAPP
jgi:uncharacterized protein